MRILKIYSLSKFQMCNTVLLIISHHIVHYVPMTDLFCNWKLVPLILFIHLHSSHPHPLASPQLSVSLVFCFFSPPDFTSKWYNAVFVFLWLFHLVWCPQDPSVLSQMARFHTFYGWIIVHYIYVPYFLYPFSYQWIFRLFLFLGSHKYCCYEQESTDIFQVSVFLFFG